MKNTAQEKPTLNVIDYLAILSSVKTSEEQTFLCCRDIASIYKNYIQSARSLRISYYQNYLNSTLSKYITGEDEYSSNPIHIKYLELMKDKIDFLEIWIRHEKQQIKEIIADALVFLLLKPAEKKDSYISLILLADDNYCIPFLKYCTDKVLTQSFMDYQKQYNYLHPSRKH